MKFHDETRTSKMLFLAMAQKARITTKYTNELAVKVIHWCVMFC